MQRRPDGRLYSYQRAAILVAVVLAAFVVWYLVMALT